MIKILFLMMLVTVTASCMADPQPSSVAAQISTADAIDTATLLDEARQAAEKASAGSTPTDDYHLGDPGGYCLDVGTIGSRCCFDDGTYICCCQAYDGHCSCELTRVPEPDPLPDPCPQ